MSTRFNLSALLPRWQDCQRQLAVLASLLFSTALCLTLLALREWRAPHTAQTWLAWNLFLAWLPALGAFAAYNLNRWPTRMRWLPVIGFVCLWLLFLPNAPYLITDIIHLKHHAGVPLWYDLLMLVAFAATGSFLGLVSLSLMQELVRRWMGTALSWLFVATVLVLNGFGIYFGRFLRWNSWDLLFHPEGMLREMWQGVLHPFEHVQTIAFAGLFTLLFSAVYLMVLSFTHLQAEHDRRE